MIRQIFSNIYRVTANVTEYHNISKLIFLRFIIPKFMKKGQYKINIFKLKYGLFGHNYWAAALSTLYLIVLGIIIPSL